MTFKDLQKLVQSQSEVNPLPLNQYQNLPFWIFDKEQHKQQDLKTRSNCCFWHVVGLPQKDGHDMPLLPYQRTLYDSLQNHKHIWIKKSRGIGVTEFLLRYVAWRCLSAAPATWSANSRVCIVTGPRIDLAEDLIVRFKGLFFGKNILLNDRTASTVAIINGVKVEASFPSR